MTIGYRGLTPTVTVAPGKSATFILPRAEAEIPITDSGRSRCTYSWSAALDEVQEAKDNLAMVLAKKEAETATENAWAKWRPIEKRLNEKHHLEAQPGSASSSSEGRRSSSSFRSKAKYNDHDDAEDNEDQAEPGAGVPVGSGAGSSSKKRPHKQDKVGAQPLEGLAKPSAAKRPKYL